MAAAALVPSQAQSGPSPTTNPSTNPSNENKQNKVEAKFNDQLPEYSQYIYCVESSHEKIGDVIAALKSLSGNPFLVFSFLFVLLVL